jgi:hypothetical protein
MTGYVDIVFAQTPGLSTPDLLFVEVENSAGESISFGKWVQRDDGYWVLRIQPHDPGTPGKWVEWVEPYSDGNEAVYMRMRVEDVIACQRRREPRYTSDEQALDDFVATQWAVYVQDAPVMQTVADPKAP